MAMIYFLDGNQEVIKIARSSAVISAIQTQELPENNSLMIDRLSVQLENDECLFDAQYMAIKSYKGNRNSFDMYRIVTEVVPDATTEFEGVQVAPYELEGVVVEDIRPKNRTVEYVAEQILADSDWRVGYVDNNLPKVTTNFYYLSAKDSLKKLQELTGVEFTFKVEISGNEITDKWVEAYRELGNRILKRFNYGTNALTVKRETNHSELYTALIGRGKGEETESGGHGRKITFKDVVWSKSSGNPVDKPAGQKYIELPEATSLYGIKQLDGTKKPRIGLVEFTKTEDPDVLIKETWEALQYYARPKVLFSATVANIGDTGIGDTVTIHRHDLNMHYKTRVRKVVRDRKNNDYTQVDIGDVVHTPSTKRQSTINSKLGNLESNLSDVQAEVSYVVKSADGKNDITYGNVEPEQKRVGDSWVRDHPSLAGETQWLVWDGEAWELIMDTSDTTLNKEAIEQAQQDIAETQATADEAVEQIDTAVANAGFSSLTDLTANLDGRTTALTANVGSITGIVTDHQDRISTVERTASGLQSTVADKANQSQVTQLSDAYNLFVSGIEDRKNLLPGMEFGRLTSNTGEEYDTTSFIRSPYIPIEDSGAYIVSLNGSPISHTFYLYTDIGEYNSSTIHDSQSKFVAPENKYIRVVINDSNPGLKYQLEKGDSPTDYVPFVGDASSAQISMLANNINLRVAKNDVINQINISDENILIQSENILLDGDVTVRGTAWMDGAVIANASIDGAKIQDATIGSAKIANIDANKITTGELKGVHVYAKIGEIGDWNLNSGILYSQLRSGFNTTIKATGDVAFSAGAPNPRDTTGATFQLWHSGRLRWLNTSGDTAGEIEVVGNQSQLDMYSGTFNRIHLPRSGFIGLTSNGELSIRNSGAFYINPGTTLYVVGDIRPSSNGNYHLGGANYRWKRVWTVDGVSESSDVRLKNNIVDIPSKLLNGIEQVEPKMYEMNGKTKFGYIAQDVERELFKYASQTVGAINASEYMKQFDVLDKNDESYQALIYSQVEVLKGAYRDKKIEELEERIEELENAG